MESAYHEAGHAVVATLLGGTVLHVTIDPSSLDFPGRDGDVSVAWAHSKFNASELLRCQLLTTLAGPAAEMNYIGEPLHPATVAQWQEDWRMAEQLVAQSRIQPARRGRLLEQMCGELFQRLGEPDLWQAIAEVADLLDAHESLEGEEVRDVTKRWITG
jgi:hypothetical protein